MGGACLIAVICVWGEEKGSGECDCGCDCGGVGVIVWVCVGVIA